MLLTGIVVGGIVGGFFGFQASSIGVTEDHQPSSPRWCRRSATACPASRFVIALVTLICAVQGSLIAGILISELF